MRLARQVTLLGAEAQARIEAASVSVPRALPGRSYAERYLEGAGVRRVSVNADDASKAAGKAETPHALPPFTELLDARSQELLRGSLYALSVLRRLVHAHDDASPSRPS